MGKTATNISIILGVITIAFGGYYLYSQFFSKAEFNVNNQTMQNMLNNTRVFIERREVLDQIEFNVAFFEDERFRSLESYTTPIEDKPIGRPNPFADVDESATN